jgi:hypothetical protein
MVGIDGNGGFPSGLLTSWPLWCSIDDTSYTKEGIGMDIIRSFIGFYGNEAYRGIRGCIARYSITDGDALLAALVDPVMFDDESRSHYKRRMENGWNAITTNDSIDMAAYAWHRTHDAFMAFIAMNMFAMASGQSLTLMKRTVRSCDWRFLPVAGGDIRACISSTRPWVVFMDGLDNDVADTYDMLIRTVHGDCDEAMTMIGRLGFMMIHRLLNGWRNLGSHYHDDLNLSKKRLLDIAMCLADDKRHVEWLADFITALRDDGEYDNMSFRFTRRRFLDWSNKGILDMPVEFLLESSNDGRDYDEYLNAALHRWKVIYNGMRKENVHSIIDLSFGLFTNPTPNILPALDSCIHEINALPDDILRIMMFDTQYADDMGMFHVYSPVRDDYSNTMVNRRDNIRILRRIASRHDNDVWYRWAVFIQVQRYLKREERMDSCMPSVRGIMKNGLHDIPAQAWGWLMDGTIPDNLTYEYECHDNGKSIMDTGGFRIWNGHDDITSISLHGWRDIPVTYGAYMTSITEPDDIDSLRLMVFHMLRRGLG